MNITVTGIGDHECYRVLNYLTSPNVLIWSAAVASCGIPHVYGPVEIYCKNENNEIFPFLSGKPRKIFIFFKQKNNNLSIYFNLFSRKKIC